MKKYIIANLLLGIFVLNLIGCKNANDKSNEKTKLAETELNEVQSWFDAWELISKDIFEIKQGKAPIMLFFDQEFLYTNSTKGVYNGIEIDGPTFSNQKVKWTKSKHNDTIRLPNGEKLTIGLLSFAVPIDNAKEESFFVMALPSLWISAEVRSSKLGDKNFYTSIFLHEFAHSQQTKNFGRQLQVFAQNQDFKYNLNDDMLQKEFEKDSLYAKSLKSEIQVFYDAYFTQDKTELIGLTKKGLKMYNERQNQFLETNEIYKELDDFFLTMEGIGQFVAYKWLISKQGADIPKPIAIEGLRRKKNNWAQEESFALFLIYSRITNPNLGKEMFEDKMIYIKDLIEKELE